MAFSVGLQMPPTKCFIIISPKECHTSRTSNTQNKRAKRGAARTNTREDLVVNPSLDLLVVVWAELAEVAPDAASESVEDTTAEVGEMLVEAVPCSTVK
jgi:hypothetical protein